MAGGGVPEDKSDKVAQIEADRAREERALRQEEEAKARRDFESRLGGAFSSGIDTARNYFSSQGLDPDQFMGAIQSAANSARSRVPQLDESPGTYFEGLGRSVFDQEQEGQRSKALRAFDTFASDGFAVRRIANDVDDPFLESILAEQRNEADEYIRRLLDRRVITNTGFDAAGRDLDRQRPGANARLQDIGLAELERGRGSLRDIASTGRTRASNLRLGDVFDPFQYQRDIDTEQSNFFAGLADRLRASAPADLFDTSGLAVLAGAAQGAGDTAFDPDAVAGLGEDDEEDGTKKKEEETEFSPF